MPLSSRLPQLTLLAALAVFTFSLFLAITSGTGISPPSNLMLILLLALSVALIFFALNPNNERAALMLWGSAGVWSAAAYLNYQTIGVLHLVVAGLSALSAFFVERESRTFSFAGPVLFISTGLILVILANFLAR